MWNKQKYGFDCSFELTIHSYNSIEVNIETSVHTRFQSFYFGSGLGFNMSLFSVFSVFILSKNLSNITFVI